MTKIKNIITQKRIRIAMFIVLDILAITMCSFLAIGLRFDFHDIPNIYIDNIYNFLIIDSIIIVVILINAFVGTVQENNAEKCHCLLNLLDFLLPLY